ncbi:STAS domain-containing protein [Donghicola sp. XS_ASV15]|uniref:STAS domain-containing protein n=1 Tax=Donghicola sp. XS_ASV15 TaxID=3241295 RepID=UPI003516A8A5
MATDSKSTVRLLPETWLDDPETAMTALREAVATGVVAIDASTGRNLPAQVLQMLLSTQRTVGAAGGTFSFTATSDGVSKSMQALGVVDLFERAAS